MDWEPSRFARRDAAALVRHRPIRGATASVVEFLERRCLLTAAPIDPAYLWAHLKPAFKHDLAILEYNNPAIEASVDGYLAALGIAPIPAQPGTLTDPGAGKSKHHHPRPHKLNLFHAKKPKIHHRKTGPTPPVVTDAEYYFDQPLPNQFAFTFDQDVTATNWDSAVSIINLSTGVSPSPRQAPIPAPCTVSSTI
jgi:hypothetical protein